MYDSPCCVCRVPRLDHDAEVQGQEWLAPDSEAITDEDAQARIRTFAREWSGDYASPLPRPAERRRIRVEAGWTQHQVADELHGSRHTVARFERIAGWRNGVRLPGREPSAETRVLYSKLLRRLDALGS